MPLLPLARAGQLAKAIHAPQIRETTGCKTLTHLAQSALSPRGMWLRGLLVCGSGDNAVYVWRESFDHYVVAFGQVVTGEEPADISPAAKDLLVSGEIGLHWSGVPVKVQDEQPALSVTRIGRPDGVGGEEAHVPAYGDVVVVEVAWLSGITMLGPGSMRCAVTGLARAGGALGTEALCLTAAGSGDAVGTAHPASGSRS